MSDLLNKASLIMVPSGYKEDTVYSVVPTDASGDLSFTRASNGTRVNSAGLVEVCPWNLLENSENFDAVWTKYNGATVTVNSIVAPNGTTTADLLISGSSQEIYSANMPKVAEELYYTFSCYAKVYNTNVFRIVCSDFSTSGSVGTFDLSTQSATFATGATWSNVSASMESVGNGWYRCILSGKSPATTGLYLSLLTNGTNSVSGVYIWGAQVNIGSTAKPYFPTTDRLNVPRLTYQNGGGGCPSLLLEKQSTNLITNSEDFTQTSWTKYQATITGNNTTSPDGTQNADKFVDNTNNDIHAVYLGITISSDTTISIYVKSAEYTRFAIANLSDGGDVIFNLSTVAVVSASANFKNNKIESVGNGWYRVSATTNGTSGGKAMGFMLVNDSNQLSFVGTGSKGVYIWGAQYETSSYSTSYIPTTSSSATRVADACYKTGISSLIGQTEGVLFADFNFENKADISGSVVILLRGSSSEAYIYLTSSTVQADFISGGIQCSIVGSIGAVGRKKIAFAYKQNDFVLYMNGVQIGTDSSGTVGSLNAITVGSYDSPGYLLNSGINQAVLFPTRLTNAELQAITTI